MKEHIKQLRFQSEKNHYMKRQFIQDITPIQQKGRRVPIHVQKRVEKELSLLIDQKHIIKLDKSSDKQFISPIVIMVKKDQTIKLALDSKKIDKLIHKNKYQMPSFELQLDNIAQIIKTKEKDPILFSTLDVRCAFLKIPLEIETRNNVISV